MSTLTKTSLANIALGHIGKAPLADIDERSPDAQTVKQHWDLVRDELLRARAWKFATKRKALSALADSPEFEWIYAYQLPADYIRAVEFNGRQAGTGEACFDVEGAALLSNETPAYLKYVARIEQVSAWDAGFSAAFALLLAAAVAPSISSAAGLGANLRERGERSAARAFGPDSGESRLRAVSATAGSGYLAARSGLQPGCSAPVRPRAVPVTAPGAASGSALKFESINEDGTATFTVNGKRFELRPSDIRDV